MGTVLLIILVLLLVGAFPRAGSYNAGWGYFPSGIVGILFIVLLVMLLTGRL